MPAPLVSVIIPTRDRAVLVVRAIESVLAQTYSHIEILVIDDGSVDDTAATITQRFGERVHFVRSETSRGVAETRNRGIALARGEYIAFLDSDDEWLPDKIARQVAVAERGEAGVIYCHAAYVDTGGSIIRLHRARHRGDVFRTMVWTNVVSGSVSALLLWRSCFDTVAPFRPGIHFEDWELWIRLASRFRFDFVDEVLVHIHFDPASRQRSLSHEDVIGSLAAVYEGAGSGFERLSRASVAYFAGIRFLWNGDRREAACWLLRSVAAVPLQKRAWLSLLVLLAGARVTAALKRFRAWLLSRRG